MRTLADIAGDNTVHTINLGNTAWWAQFAVTGAGNVRIGDSDVSSSRGIPVPAGGGFMLPFQGRENKYGPTFYAYIPTGATLSVAYA